MSSDVSRQNIINITTALVARRGIYGLSMRDVAKESGMAVSAMYHYFANKEELLKSTFDAANLQLTIAREQLPHCATASEMLRQRIRFQIDHAEEIVAILKYYLSYRHIYHKSHKAILPDRAYLHITEVLLCGMQTGEFVIRDIIDDAQVITHAVNGFVLEYYPKQMSEQEKRDLTEKMYNFLIRALIKEQVVAPS